MRSIPAAGCGRRFLFPQLFLHAIAERLRLVLSCYGERSAWFSTFPPWRLRASRRVAVDVQVQVAPGLPAFAVVGLADKAVSEARERVRSALIASGLALPARRITVNLAPADLPKEGSHYDLPIALGADGGDRRDPARCAGRLHRARRTRARRLDRAGGRRAAGGDRRQCPRRGADLPGRLRLRGGLGQPRHRRSSPPAR